jgi:hypothetical protein
MPDLPFIDMFDIVARYLRRSIMEQSISSSPALPIAHVVLRILIVLNWVSGAAILVLLVAMPTERWILTLVRISRLRPRRTAWSLGLRGNRGVGLAAIPLHYLVLQRLLAIVETVRAGDPFVAANALRLAGDRLDAPRAATAGVRGGRHRPARFRLRRTR